MFGEMPALVDPAGMEIDPVTGAILSRSRRPSFTHNRNRSSGSFQGVPISASNPGFAPPYGYSYQGYIASPYLSPTAQLSPLPGPSTLVPAQWVQAYYDQYNQPAPYFNQQFEYSPRRRALNLPSPQVSPYRVLQPLPLLPNESDYQDTRETWASRFRNWIGGENRSDPHSHLLQDIRIHQAFHKKESDIVWNLTYPPHTVTMFDPPDPNTSAFEPPLAHCQIVCTILPWRMDVEARDGQAYITVIGLMSEVYDMLKKAIDRNTYEGMDPEFKSEVNQAYYRRCVSIPDEEASDAAFKYGIRRVDYLLDKIIFAGLFQIKNLYQTFEIKLASKA